MTATIPYEDGVVIADAGDDPVVEEEDGATITHNADGTIDVTYSKPHGPSGFYANLAEEIDDIELQHIGEELFEGIQADEDSRKDWLNQYADGLDLLGTKVKTPKSQVTGGSVSSVDHPLMLEAVLRFQANAAAELLPAAGPCKVETAGMALDTQQRANDYEDDFNRYLTHRATEYYPDTRQMLFYVGYGGSAFKKVYNCPLRRRPVSEAVMAPDLIVNATCTDIQNASRVTHQFQMRRAVLKRMQLVGAYRDVDLGHPEEDYSEYDQAEGFITGIDPQGLRPEDAEYTLYESYCELDLKGFEHEEDGEKTGLALPYRVTLDKNTHKVLELRRDWDENDPTSMRLQTFVKFPYVEAMGFYCIGLLHILGSTTVALRGVLRELIDAGMFSCFPGFLYLAGGGQETNVFTVAPGTGQSIKSNGQMAINQMVMPLPYKEPSQTLMALLEHLEEMGQRLGGTAEVQVGEGKQDAPVGTTIALIEQATKLQAAVHKGLHSAQAQEFAIFKRLFAQNPQALIQGNANPKRNWSAAEEISDLDLIPASDPNIPSQMHRLMLGQAFFMATKGDPFWDKLKVNEYVWAMAGIPKVQQFVAPPPPPGSTPPDPNMVKAQAQQQANKLKAMELQQQAQQHQTELQQAQIDNHTQLAETALRAKEMALESRDRAADRQSRERIAALALLKQRQQHQADQNRQARDHVQQRTLAGQKIKAGVNSQVLDHLHDHLMASHDAANEHALADHSAANQAGLAAQQAALQPAPSEPPDV